MTRGLCVISALATSAVVWAAGCGSDASSTGVPGSQKEAGVDGTGGTRDGGTKAHGGSADTSVPAEGGATGDASGVSNDAATDGAGDGAAHDAGPPALGTLGEPCTP